MTTKLHLTLIAVLTVSVQSFTPIAKSAEGYDDNPYNSTFGLPWLHDKGILLFAPGDELSVSRESTFKRGDWHKADNRRTLPFGDHAFFSVSLQNDYMLSDEDAKPATFAWTKDAGADAFWESDAALRIDFWAPNGLYDPVGMETSISFGAEWDKVPGDEEIDRRTYHLGVTLAAFPGNRIPLMRSADQVVQIGAVHTRDGISGEESLDWSVDWQPAFKMGPMAVGMRCGFDGEILDPNLPPTRAYYYLRPDVGVAYGERALLGHPVSALENDWTASYEVRAGVGFLVGWNGIEGRIDLSYRYKGGVAAEGEDFNYHETRLSVIPNNKRPASIDLAYLRGNDGFGTPDVDRVRVGFGLQF